MAWAWIWIVNLKKETESLIIDVQNYSISINYIEAKIDNSEQNSMCN